MEKDTIANILGKHHYMIKQSYYGGITEAYISKGRDVKSYDINSLYPSSMHDFDMPVGIPTYFHGDISLSPLGKEELPFGFLKVKVNAPLTIKCPALPYRIKTPESKGVRTIFPVGN
jgi:hypothetical protein